MIRAVFKGGPIDGQTKELPVDEPPLEVFVPLDPGSDTGPMSNVGKERYVLGRVDDRKGVVHYYVPTSGKSS